MGDSNSGVVELREKTTKSGKKEWIIHKPKPNPFENNPPPIVTPLNIIRILLATILVVPFRIFAFLFFLCFAPPALYLGSRGVLHPSANNDKFTWKNEMFVAPVRLITRIILFWAAVWHVSVRHEGPMLPGSIFVCNHISMLDALHFSWWHCCCTIGKFTIRRNWPIGASAVLLRAIWLDRDSPESRRYCVQEMTRRARSPPGNFPTVLVFPEGTNTSGYQLIKFKPGAFQVGVPVTPFLVRFPPCFGYNPAATGYNCGFLPVLRMFFMFYVKMEVIQMETYVPSEEEKANPQLYANNVRDVMAKRLGVPTTEHSYEDFLLFKQYRDLNIPQTFEFVEIREHLGLKVFQLKWLTDQYSKMWTHKRQGSIDITEFAQSINLEEDSPYVNRLFSFLDRNSDGRIDYEEFLWAIWFAKTIKEQRDDPNEIMDEHLRLCYEFYAGTKSKICFDDIRALCNDANIETAEHLFSSQAESTHSELNEGGVESSALSYGGFEAFCKFLPSVHDAIIQEPLSRAVDILKPWSDLYEEAFTQEDTRKEMLRIKFEKRMKMVAKANLLAKKNTEKNQKKE